MGNKNGKYIPCENCGKLTYKTAYNIQKAEHHFCSATCANKWRSNNCNEMRVCPICKTEFRATKASTQRFCSQRCQAEWQKTLVGEKSNRYINTSTTCAWCKQKFHIAKHRLELPYTHFCSQRCRREWYAKVWSQSDEWRAQSSERAVRILKEGLCTTTNSRPQREVNKILDELHIQYINEYALARYSIDNYLPDYHLAIEVMGDYWHTNPLKYGPDYLPTTHQIKVQERDSRKHECIVVDHQCPILYLWESDVIHNRNLCVELIRATVRGDLLDEHSYNWELSYIENERCIKKKTVQWPSPWHYYLNQCA